jgi:subtilisin family serine protease
VAINVAVLYTGTGPHVDLNVVGGTSCLRTGKTPSGFGDINGHGTMVGGLLAARDNAIGHVGIAPGARLWPVQVLDERGFGTTSEVICGLDWVVGTRTDADAANDILVANMSLGGPLPVGPTGSCADAPDRADHRAICATVAAGHHDRGGSRKRCQEL